jgi:hypothetical protein
MATTVAAPKARLRREWAATERAAFIGAVTIAMGALFLTTYTLALGDPVPHRIDAALVGSAQENPRAISDLERVTDRKLALRHHASLGAARDELDRQRIYAALDLTATRPTLYIASAAGASVARVLERVSPLDAHIRVVDLHPLAVADPIGVDVFYMMLIATIVGFLTVFQVRANAGGLPLKHWTVFVAGYAFVASLALTLVVGPLLNRFDVPVPETWGILFLHVLAVSSFASVMTVLVGRWAILPTWLFFVVLGNSASGGAVAPPLLPAPFAFLSQWLPSGATVTSLRNAIYFPNFQHARPLLVIGAWAALLFGAMVVTSHRRRMSPGVA